LENDVNRKKIEAGPGKQGVTGKQLRLAQEIKYIQRRAAEYDARFVTVGPLVFFSTETGDAWMLDPADQLAARLARDGDPEAIDFDSTASGGKDAVYSDSTFIRRSAALRSAKPQGMATCQKISNMFG
jgi:hypothetical protein